MPFRLGDVVRSIPVQQASSEAIDPKKPETLRGSPGKPQKPLMILSGPVTENFPPGNADSLTMGWIVKIRLGAETKEPD